MVLNKTIQEIAEIIVAAEMKNEANNPILYMGASRKYLQLLYESLQEADECFAINIAWQILLEMLFTHYVSLLKDGSDYAPLPCPPMPFESFIKAMQDALRLMWSQYEKYEKDLNNQ
jgi:hypothetical protein